MDILQNGAVQEPPPYKIVQLISGTCELLREPTAEDLALAYRIMDGKDATNMVFTTCALVSILCRIDGKEMIYEDVRKRLKPMDVFTLMVEVFGGNPVPSEQPSPALLPSGSDGQNLKQ